MALTASEIAHERTIRERYAGKGGLEQQMDLEKIYAQMLSVRGMLRESGGKDVALQ